MKLFERGALFAGLLTSVFMVGALATSSSADIGPVSPERKVCMGSSEGQACTLNGKKGTCSGPHPSRMYCTVMEPAAPTPPGPKPMPDAAPASDAMPAPAPKPAPEPTPLATTTTEPAQVTAPSAATGKKTGCSTSGGESLPGAALLLGVALVATRRRRAS